MRNVKKEKNVQIVKHKKNNKKIKQLIMMSCFFIIYWPHNNYTMML